MTSRDLLIARRGNIIDATMRSLVIANSGKERRTSLSGEMVEEEMENKGWGSLARGGRKASLPVLTSYKRLPMMDTVDSNDTVDSRIKEGASSRESSGSRNKRRETRDRKSTTPSRFLPSFSCICLSFPPFLSRVPPAH